MYIVQYINFIVYTLFVDSRYFLLSTVRVLGTICTTNEFILCGSGSALCMFPLIVMSCFLTYKCNELFSTMPMDKHHRDTATWSCLASAIKTVIESTRCTLGNGSRISFWHDWWLDCGRLKFSFPILFTFAQSPYCTVASQFTDGQWNLKLHPNLTMTATREMEALLMILVGVHPSISHTETDQRNPCMKSGKVTTAFFYELLTFRGILCPAAPKIWDTLIPNRHRVFLWLALRGRLNTRDNILKRGWTSITTHNGCDLCPATENSSHIILRCRLADAVWERAGVQDKARSSNDLQIFLLATEPPAYGNLWHIVFAACAVSLWSARNEQVFQHTRWSAGKVLSTIADLLRLWSNRANNNEDRIKLCNFAALFHTPFSTSF